jgi:hypothetical protein
MPVSRDDVILTDPIFYNFAKEELYKLIDDLILQKHDADMFFAAIKNYAEYSKDSLIYQLIEEGYEYISKKENVLLVPLGYGKYYDSYIAPYFHNLIFLESNRVNYNTLRELVISKLEYVESKTISNRKLFLVKNQSDIYTDGGLFDILFLNEEYVKNNPKDWEQKLNLQLTFETFKNGFESISNELKNLFVSFKNTYMTRYPLTEGNLLNVYGDIKGYVLIFTRDEKNNIQVYSPFIENPNFDRLFIKMKKELPPFRFLPPTKIIESAMDIVYPYIQKFYDIISLYETPQYYNTIRFEKFFNYLFGTVASSYIIFKKDVEFLDKFSNILYIFLLKFKYRKIEDKGQGNTKKFNIELYMSHETFKKYNYFSDNKHIQVENFPYINFSGKTLYDLDTPEQKENFINYINFFYKEFLEIKNSDYEIRNPLKLFFMQRISYAEKFPIVGEEDINFTLKIRDDIGGFNKNFILSKHYVYWLYLDTFSTLYFRKNTGISLSKFKKCMEFIYRELQNKYNFDYLERYIKISIKIYDGISIFDLIIQELVSIANVYDSIATDDTYLYNLVSVQNLKKEFSFDAIQLLNYVYEHEVDMGKLDWFKNIKDFTPSHDSKFQALEIVINEGTSKSFANSVITEMIQNSIDASRKETDFVCKLDDGYFIYKTDKLEPLPNKPKEKVRNCPGIKIECGEIKNMGNAKGLTVTDYIGIPTQGIISLLIPFLSTKTSKEELSTGEMGTGFMNVYRQPYTKKVIIQTRNPSDHFIYRIEAIPILSQNKKRVLNVQYNISKTTETYNESFRHTCITVLFNENLDEEEISSLFTDIELYSNRILPILSPSTILTRRYNNNTIITKLKLLFENDRIGKIYSSDQKIPSYILTNGVPFGDLSPYVYNLPDAGFWLYQYGLTQIVVDLNKSVYVPTQSRKRIKLHSGAEGVMFNYFIKDGIFEHIIENIDIKELSESNYLYGLSYVADPDSRRPIISGNEFFNYATSGMHHKSYALIINNIIDDVNRNKTTKYSRFRHNSKYLDIVEYINKKKEIVPPKYYNIIREWFKNKIYIKEFATEGAKIVQKISNDRVPDYVLYFIKNLIIQMWQSAQKYVKEDLIRGLHPEHIKRPPMKVIYGSSDQANGYYDPVKHEIFLKLSHIEEDKEFHKGVREIKMLKDMGEITKMIKFDSKFKNITGINTDPQPTIIHELCHAYLEQNHKGDVHGNFTIEVRATRNSKFEKKEYSFYNGATQLFLLFLQNYKPYWL